MTRGVLVVGAGVAGAAVALALRKRDTAVLVVDRSAPGSRATGASAGMLAAQYEEDTPGPGFRLGLVARELQPPFLHRIEALSGTDLGRRARGMLVANTSTREHRAASRTAEWQRRAGLRAEILPLEEASRLQPGIGREAHSYLWLPDEAQVDAQRLAQALPAALEAAGARTVSGVAAEGLLRDGRRVAGVRLADDRTLEAETVVLAAGAWSDGLEGLPRPVPVRPVRGQILRFPPGGFDCRRILARHDGRYLVPRSDGSLLAGSTMEDAGFDAVTTPEGEREIREGATALLPALAGTEPTERWAGLRPVSPDALPILGPDPELEGLHYATGYGRNGILLAPAGGEAVAGLIRDGATWIDWHPFRPERFQPAARGESPAPGGVG